MSEQQLVILKEALAQMDLKGKKMPDSFFINLKNLARQLYGAKLCLCSGMGIINFWIQKRSDWNL